jgi:hypothetical protein
MESTFCGLQKKCLIHLGAVGGNVFKNHQKTVILFFVAIINV